MKTKPRLLAVFFGTFGILLSACDGEANLKWSKPSCDSEREIAGWTVSAGLDQASPGGLMVSKWEAQKNYTYDFGLRVRLNTSDGPTPYLQIWHNYKTGEFKMSLPDNGEISSRLDSAYALTEVQLRPVDVEFLRRYPVRFEHTAHDGKWSVYQTDGLPEAIAGAEADLALIRQRLKDQECKL